MMIKILSNIFFWLFAAVSPLLLIAFGAALWRVLATASFTAKPLQFFALGAVLFVPCFYVMRRFSGSRWNYLTTLEHECSHAVAAFLFLKKPVGMRVTARHGGEFQYSSTNDIGKTWILLAPYFLPPLSLVVLFGGWLLRLTENSLFFAVLGWTVAFHLITNWQETSFRQTDLQNVGVLKTILLLPLSNLLTYGSIWAFVMGGRTGLISFWLNGSANLWQIIINLKPG